MSDDLKKRLRSDDIEVVAAAALGAAEVLDQWEIIEQYWIGRVKKAEAERDRALEEKSKVWGYEFDFNNKQEN